MADARHIAERAVIEVLEGADKGKIEVMYNPREYTVSTKADVQDAGSGIKFDKVKINDFTVPLFFDTYEKQTDVRKETQRIASLLMPTVEGKEIKHPPLCRFLWGGFSYKGIVSKVEQKFTMFLSSGIPVRAELTVTFKSVETTEENALLKGREACRKLWTVKSGDRLDLIAYRTLKDPAQWKKIAVTNNIINPLLFPTDDDLGTRLIIPD